MPSPCCPSAAPTNTAIQIPPLGRLSCTSPGFPRVWAGGQQGRDATRGPWTPLAPGCSTPGCWNLSSGHKGFCPQPGATRATLAGTPLSAQPQPRPGFISP